MPEQLVSATIRPGDLPVVKLENATLAQIEEAARSSQPFDAELKACILEIAGRGKRVHLTASPGVAYLTGDRVYNAFDSSKKAFGWAYAMATAV